MTDAIIITEKDAVKILAEFAKTNWNIPIFVICVEVKFQTGASAFQNELRRRLSEKLGRRK